MSRFRYDDHVDIHCSPLIHRSSEFIVEDVSVKHGLSWVNLSWPFLVTLLFTLWKMASKRTCSMTFPRTKVTPVVTWIIFAHFWRCVQCLPSVIARSQLWETPDHHGLIKVIVSRLPMISAISLSISSGAVDLHGWRSLGRSLTWFSFTTDNCLSWS